MTPAQLTALGPKLTAALRPFQDCCQQQRTRDHLHTYCRGLLSDLQRKSVEPMALQAGTAVRTLQEFLRDHSWQDDAICGILQEQTARRLPTLADDDLGTVGLIDETSAVKSGTQTPGVQRQYLGCVGKVENGIVTVHVGLCKGRYKVLLDGDLYLPKSWDADRQRCRQASIPDSVVYRPKWQIALEQLDRLRAHGIVLDWLTFDEEYGKSPGMIAGLDQRQQRFVGEVPRTFSCLAAVRSGRRPAAGAKGRPAEEVVRHSSVFRSQPWQILHLQRETLQDQVWRVKAARVWLSSATGWSAGTYWLIWASNDATGEEKFFLSNATEETPVEVVVRAAFRRACVEHSFRVCKSELGFTHYEGRSYTGLMRHLRLCLVVLNFAAEHCERLRGEKCGGDAGASMPRAARGVPQLAAAAAADQRAAVRGRDHCLPPSAEPRGHYFPEEEAAHGPEPQEAA